MTVRYSKQPTTLQYLVESSKSAPSFGQSSTLNLGVIIVFSLIRSALFKYTQCILSLRQDITTS